MLKILRGDSTGEMELSGTRAELREVARKIRHGKGAIFLTKVSTPFPYSRSLLKIDCLESDGKVRLLSSGGNETLVIEGQLNYLALLAENIEGFALEADEADHLHVDYFPDHDYLAEESGTLVVAIDSDESGAS